MKYGIINPHWDYWTRKQNSLIFIANPGLGKTHFATGIALAACHQSHKVHFWTVAGLVIKLLLAQDEHWLHRFIASALKMDLVVLDELGFVPVTPGPDEHGYIRFRHQERTLR